MRIEEYIKMWGEDCKIREPLHQDSQLTFEVHNKYYKYLMKERLALKMLEIGLDELREDLDEYYQGAHTEDLLERLGMEPYLLNPVRNAEARSRKITSTSKFVQKSLEILAEREKVDYLKEIVQQIKDRRWIIKNMIESKKFDAGL